MAPPTQDPSPTVRPVPRAPLPLTRPEIATLAMQRFHCTGGDCPDTCCKDFGISVDRKWMKRMRDATRDARDRDHVVRLVVWNHPPGQGAQALVPLNEQGACPLLESSGACTLHRQYGEAALGTACSVFPRTSLLVDDHLEVSGTLACPELARLTLLSDDGVEQAESPLVLLPRDYVGKAIHADDEEDEPYAAPFDRVRAALRELLRRPGYPLSSRLIFAGQLAAQVDDFFHAGTRAFHGKRRRFAQQRLHAELALPKDLPTLENLHRDLGAFTGDDRAVLGTVASLLRQRLRLAHPPRFAVALAGLGEPGGADDPTRFPRLLATSARLTRQFPGILDRILARYAQHYLLRHPYTDAPDLGRYLGRLALALAAIKAMTLVSPTLEDCLERPGVHDHTHALEQLVVDQAQLFTKVVSHQADFLATFHQAFESGPGTAFGRLALFAHFLA